MQQTEKELLYFFWFGFCILVLFKLVNLGDILSLIIIIPAIALLYWIIRLIGKLVVFLL